MQGLKLEMMNWRERKGHRGASGESLHHDSCRILFSGAIYPVAKNSSEYCIKTRVG
jgi:hypothetical protein